MKKRIALIVASLLVLTLVFGACTATPDQEKPSGDGSTSDESSYDQIMRLLETPESALALSGVQPRELPDRQDVPKGLDNLTPKPANEIKIGWAAASLGSEFFEGLRDSAFAQAESHGISASQIDMQNADFNLETQQQQVDTFITNKVDAMILNAVDLHSSVQLIEKIVDAGIPVFVTGPTAAKPEYQMITAVISGSNESGFQIGSYSAEKLYKKGEVLDVGMVISKLEDADSNSRPCGWIAGFLYKSAEMDGNAYDSKYDAILEAYHIWTKYKSDKKYDLSEKGLNLVQLGVGEGTDAAKGQAATADILVASPDMDLLVVEMDSMAVGALSEIKVQGKTPGKDIMVVTCADGTTTSLDFIKSGELMGTATNIPFMNSTTMIDMIYELFAGDDPEAYAKRLNDMPATSFTPTMAVTAENVEQYYPDTSDPIFGKFAKYDPWVPMTVTEFNAAHAND